MKKTKKIIGTFGIAIIGGLIAVSLYSIINKNNQKIIITREEPSVRYASLPPSTENGTMDFTYAAEVSLYAVVHVKTKSLRGNYTGNPLYDFFFGQRYYQEPQPVMGYGSGVIVSEDGYIVTNNHVIDKSDEIEVVLNDRRTYTAKIVGVDLSTDLALLKIEDDGKLPHIQFGNSDLLKIGEWVLAVGNPYNLTSTVTAGIVSAKARNINIMRDRAYAVESFIQTDAAVNPGNSGGALVNVKGELVGINTAIASQTGAYSGYSFAIPVNIVKKIVTDLIDFGEVQRALIGVTIQDVTAELAKEKGLDKIEGVYINGVRDDGAAREAGIKEGDVILEVNGVKVNNTSELQEQVSMYRPKDVIEVLIKRDNKKKQFTVTLRNMQGNTDIVKKEDQDIILGAKCRVLDENEKKRLGINFGVKIIELNEGKFKKAGVENNFIITRINNKTVHSVSELKDLIEYTSGGIYIEGIYPDGVIAYYAFGL